MIYLVTAEELEKSFGRKQALSGATFNIREGRITGLMGENGSGKTTLLKIIAGLNQKSGGSISVFDKNPGAESKLKISFMPDRNFLYKGMKVSDGIKFFHDMFPDFDSKKCDELIDFMKLNKNDLVKSLSKGMCERFLLALTFSRQAQLFILDEPFGGVDPIAKTKIIDAIINYYNSQKCTVLISTHLIADVERIFDDVLFLKKGKIILSGESDVLREQHNKSIEQLYVEVFGNE